MADKKSQASGLGWAVIVGPVEPRKNAQEGQKIRRVSTINRALADTRGREPGVRGQRVGREDGPTLPNWGGRVRVVARG